MSDIITVFHGTDCAYRRFPNVASGIFEDGGVCLTTSLPLARCYGENVLPVAIPAGEFRVHDITPAEWFLTTDAEIDRLKRAGFDGLRVLGDMDFNRGPEFEPADASFFWDWYMFWNTEILNGYLLPVIQDGKLEFENLPEVDSAMKQLVAAPLTS